ncbi:hypothetical protein OC846_006148 [Tilletia horrida]|uniref:Protein kinase domain-containing protein n=1 Tax=Tilletia horrida TaxID=155126 RepID=A0AAN6JP90_9BASI|nr:hypothetical protein OC846_006148 [Tilletia horrida]
MFIRNGTASDPKAAMLGAGAFGAAFLYVQPPPPIDATINQAERSATSKMIEQELLPELSDKGRPDADPTADQQASGPGQVILDGRTARARSGSVLRSAASLPQLKSSTGPPLDDKKGNVTAPQSPHQSPVNGSYSAVVIKACRSPITGEFDELLRASVRHRGCRAGWHTRVVRGENRILRYIQKARVLEAAYQRGFHLNSDPSGVDNVVKLLADLPADGRSGEQIFETTPFCTQMPWTVASSTTTKVVQQRQGDDHISAAVAAGLCPDGRPPHRMLVFEPLVDLDAEFIDGTWCRTLKPWTVRQVEDAARDTVAGLQFLHAHAVVHADLKPANLMRDPRTGAVKLIDLGGARRFVSLEDQFVNSITVVEERDAAMNNAETEAALLRQTPVAGLTSLTGSPHFMAPEILLQACRYRDSTGASRCVLKDYKRHPERLPDSAEMGLLRLALDDYATGWGTKADIWSWACCVLSFIVRMSTFVEDREVTSLICPFDFVFDNEDDDDEDALYPMHAMRQHELEVPHYHRWARQYPLRIQRIAVEGVCVDADVLEDLSPALNRMIHAAFRHHAQRPTAASIAHVLRSGENKDRRSQAAEAPARTSMMTVDSEATLKDSAKAFSEVGCGSPPPQVRAPPTPRKEPTSRPSRTDLALPKPMVTVAMELDPPVRTCLATAQAIQGTQSIPVPATAATRTNCKFNGTDI